MTTINEPLAGTDLQEYLDGRIGPLADEVVAPEIRRRLSKLHCEAVDHQRGLVTTANVDRSMLISFGQWHTSPADSTPAYDPIHDRRPAALDEIMRDHLRNIEDSARDAIKRAS